MKDRCLIKRKGGFPLPVDLLCLMQDHQLYKRSYNLAEVKLCLHLLGLYTSHNMHRQTLLSFLVILTLTLHTCVSEPDILHPPRPCTKAENKNSYNTFLKRHVRNDTPTDLNKEHWKKFINRINTWNRTIQSFFPFSEKDNVEAVCSSGGKMFKDNLCISKKPFSFITVKIVSKKKIIKSVDLQKQHVILACDKFANKCLPDHFKANTKKCKPDNNKPDCSKLNRNLFYEEVFPWL